MSQSINSSDLARSADVSKQWVKPEFRRLKAGTAEAAGHAGNDGTTNLS